MYVLCFTRPRYQVSVYRTIGPLVSDLNLFICINVSSHLMLRQSEQSCYCTNGALGLLTRSDTNQAVQPQMIARGLKIRISKVHVEGLCYLCSKSKGAN